MSSAQPHPAHGSSVALLSARDELAAELSRIELLPYYDVDAAGAALERLDVRLSELDDQELTRRAQLVRADVLLRKGTTAPAGQLALEVNRWAQSNANRYLLCRSHRLLCTFFDRIGDSAAALEHGLRTVELTDEDLPLRMRVGHLMGLSQALARTGSFDAARLRYRAAQRLAQTLGDVDVDIHILNDLAWLEHDAGELSRSLEFAHQMQACAAEHGVELPASALDTVARTEMALGRFADAEATMRHVIEADVDQLAQDQFDGLAESLLTVAEIQRMQGHTADARTTLSRVLALCDRGDLVSVRVWALLQQAELAAVEGNYREAFELHKRFHVESEALSSAERDAKARTLQAVFETTEARREGQRFREMSLRDPLTGLHNRRYVDEELPLLLSRALERATPLVVALVDIDHFKAINDAFSHDVGDDVLRRVAHLLAAATTDIGFTARMGGEEFLFVLPDLDAQSAGEVLEGVRRDVATHDWRDLGVPNPLTISIGATAVQPGRTTRAALLSQADRNLYSAKRAGRNQVVCDFG